MAQRPPLSLTAELERLEQQITLTYQEIDHNFAKAHRIVTGSILPIVERYAKESEAVWEGSKFWKQFFEASANVALSNYQEDEAPESPQHGNEDTLLQPGEETTQHESTFPASSPGNYTRRSDNDTVGLSHHHHEHDDDDVPMVDDDSLLDDSLLESLDLGGGGGGEGLSTPKAASQWAAIDSPYAAVKREYDYEESPAAPQLTTNLSAAAESSMASSRVPPPSTPRRQMAAGGGDTTMATTTAGGRTPATQNRHDDTGMLMHRQLDRNWRIQATPLGKPAASRYRSAKKPAPSNTAAKKLFGIDLDSSPLSPQEPQLHTTFFSPAAAAARLKTPTTARHAAVRTPGTRGGGFGGYKYGDSGGGGGGADDSDDSDELLMSPGYSPPKTMQFSLPPSKLLATPAREASRRIVHDILQTAGASMDESNATADTTRDELLLGSSPIRTEDDDDPF